MTRTLSLNAKCALILAGIAVTVAIVCAIVGPSAVAAAVWP